MSMTRLDLGSGNSKLPFKQKKQWVDQSFLTSIPRNIVTLESLLNNKETRC